MNSMHAIDPSLRSGSLNPPSNQKSQTQHYPETGGQSYSPIQPSPNTSYQNPNYYSNTQPVQGSPEEDSPDATNQHDPNDLKRPRACEACRQLKVKCELEDDNPNGSCKRCTKARRQCIITTPSRKRQKKTDSRVAELEKKIDALTASLAARGESETDANLDPAISRQDNSRRPLEPGEFLFNGVWSSQIDRSKENFMNEFGNSGPKRKRTESGLDSEDLRIINRLGKRLAPSGIYNEARQTSDVIERGIIDVKTAYRCFERYCHEMSLQLPIVVFPPQGTNPEDIRRTKPILFLAIIGVASGTIRPDLQARLISEATKILADRIVYNGEKSMELVQTIQVMTVFYQPPERYEELNFNQLIHVGAVMAMDIGMGKRSHKGTSMVWKASPDRNKVPDPNAPETRRCWLGCYYMCSNSSMSLRRSFLLRWSSYCDECIEILENAPNTLTSDIWLCHLVKAQRIAEDVNGAFFMDDPAKEVSLSDPATQKQLESLEKELEIWRSQLSPEMSINPIMQHTEGILNLYMHEIAMHNEHNVDDFRPPYHATPIEGPPNPETPLHLKSLGICLRSAHSVFDSVLSMDVNLVRSLPTHFFVRTSYAAVALIKMYTAIAAKGSHFIKLCKPGDLKVDHYLDRLISTFTKVAQDGMSKVAYKFSLIFNMLKSWHVRRTGSPPNQENSQSTNQRGSQKVTNGRASKQNSTSKTNQQAQKDTQQSLWQSSGDRMSVNQSNHPHSGLQMLSDAAMAPNPQQTQQGQWISPSGNVQHQSMQMDVNSGMGSSGPVPIDATMMAGVYGLPNDQMALMDFTSDELMAYGFGDEFMAMNFGFDPGQSGSGGWAI